MEKKYIFEEEPTPMVNEPMAEYKRSADMKLSPPLTKEELANAITGDELIEYMYDHIHKLFNGK